MILRLCLFFSFFLNVAPRNNSRRYPGREPDGDPSIKANLFRPRGTACPRCGTHHCARKRSAFAAAPEPLCSRTGISLCSRAGIALQPRRKFVAAAPDFRRRASREQHPSPGMVGESGPPPEKRRSRERSVAVRNSQFAVGRCQVVWLAAKFVPLRAAERKKP